MLMHSGFIITMVFTMILGLYYDKRPDRIPELLAPIYQNPSDLWQWSVMIIMMFWWIFIIGFFCVFMGWKMMHPLQTKAIDIRERRKELLQKSHELKAQVMKELKESKDAEKLKSKK